MIVIAKDLSCGNLNLILFIIARLSKSRGNLNLILFVILRGSKPRGNPTKRRRNPLKTV